MAGFSASDYIDQWYFTKERLENSPSRKCGLTAQEEAQCRLDAITLIMDMGRKLGRKLKCTRTAIVYLQRFYIFHSFTKFPWHQMATAAIFLASKVEEHPVSIQECIRAENICRNPEDAGFDINSERYNIQLEHLNINEHILVQTIGFDFNIIHPHVYVKEFCEIISASKLVLETSYFLASHSLKISTMCIQYKPTIVACFCILLACKWINWKIPKTGNREWYEHVDDHTVTAAILSQVDEEFLLIFENCPISLQWKRNIRSRRTKEQTAANDENRSGSNTCIAQNNNNNCNMNSGPSSSGISSCDSSPNLRSGRKPSAPTSTPTPTSRKSAKSGSNTCIAQNNNNNCNMNSGPSSSGISSCDSFPNLRSGRKPSAPTSTPTPTSRKSAKNGSNTCIAQNNNNNCNMNSSPSSSGISSSDSFPNLRSGRKPSAPTSTPTPTSRKSAKNGSNTCIAQNNNNNCNMNSGPSSSGISSSDSFPNLRSGRKPSAPTSTPTPTSRKSAKNGSNTCIAQNNNNNCNMNSGPSSSGISSCDSFPNLRSGRKPSAPTSTPTPTSKKSAKNGDAK